MAQPDKASMYLAGLQEHYLTRRRHLANHPVCTAVLKMSSGEQTEEATNAVHPIPDYPWQVVGTDLFELDAKHYLLIVDYFSRYPEIIKMSSTTSVSTIAALKNVFSRHGIPEVVRSENGPQYSSQEFAAFSKAYSFKHITSSPLYPQSNGQVKRTVDSEKDIETF